MLHNLYKALYYISFGSLLVPFLLGAIKFKTLNNTLRVLFFYLLISVITEILSYLLPGKCLSCFYAVQNTFTILEGLFFVAIYLTIFTATVSKYIVATTGVIYIIFAASNFLSSKSYFGADNLVSMVETVIIISLSILFYFKVFIDLRVSKFNSYSFILLNSAVLIFFSSSFVLFLFDDLITHISRMTFEHLWSLHLVTNITYNIFLAAVIWKQHI